MIFQTNSLRLGEKEYNRKMFERKGRGKMKKRASLLVLVALFGMATVFLTNFIRCRTSFRMLFRLTLTMSLLGCDDLRQELTIKVRLPR
ncbi:hypothetical protein CYQ64_01340 [Enterococcus faecium]|nr:hypothetical protein CYQ64_01340 [Enterococcus faecium]